LRPRAAGRSSACPLSFWAPFLDIGIGQSRHAAGRTGHFGAVTARLRREQVLIDGALRNGFDEALQLLIALAWVAVLAARPSRCSTEVRDLRGTDPPPGSQIVGLDDPASPLCTPYW
jgi:hypothetical protein